MVPSVADSIRHSGQLPARLLVALASDVCLGRDERAAGAYGADAIDLTPLFELPGGAEDAILRRNERGTSTRSGPRQARQK